MDNREKATPPPERHVSILTKIIGVLIGIFGALMLLGIILFSTFGVFSIEAATQPPVSTHSTQMLVVTGMPTITLTGGAADMQFVAGASSQVSIVVDKSVRAISHDQAQHDLAAIKVDVQQQGNAITINETIPDDWGWNFWWFHVGNHTIKIVVTVPSSTNIAVKAATGNIQVNGVTGTMTLDASAGNLDFHNVTLTGNSHLQAAAGNVTITGAMGNGATLTLASSAGNFSYAGTLGSNDAITLRLAAGNATLRLPTGTATHIDARVTAGDISVSGVPLTANRQLANASLLGDTAPNPTNTISVQMSTGNFSFMEE